MSNFKPEGQLLKTDANKANIKSISALRECMQQGTVCEARVLLCDSYHNLIVDLGDFK